MHNKPCFDLGEVHVTQAALDALAEASVDLSVYLSRHISVAAFEGYFLISSFGLSPGKSLLIITEADRSMTTVQLFDEL